MSNTFGTLLKLTTYGESHGESIGGVLDGCPAGFYVDVSKIQEALNKRKPGTNTWTSPRKESDEVQILSGIYQGKTLGTPIGFCIKNEDKKSEHYQNLENVFRPSHADYTYQAKYKHRDARGGGRSSARETACRVVAGAIAQQILEQISQIVVKSYVCQIGDICLPQEKADIANLAQYVLQMPNHEYQDQAITKINALKEIGDSVGGCIQTIVLHAPVGLGEPIFDKLHAKLAYAMFSIPAVKGFELGQGFTAASMLGSQHNDAFYTDKNGNIKTKTNHSAGIQGGISNGEEIMFKTAFKPVSSIKIPQNTVNKAGEAEMISIQGRHDPCVVPRAVPIVNAMTALVLLDFILQDRAKSF